ncbi:SDR family NAD(P)-dependent oxidoreductase [Sinimarinibacterium sp. NLF-5-8]|uniref:SDR family NAD(P)-dependent oxidoreductase n=1 Tax=Sinimarinibacterium sp. NLF-5-8 TaxID=2698684 RepID=UPI00137BD524|nr:SDR family oxidoreductase [Sinimarinibacterium sp. NLF-5-8]QHS10323.1 SDR family oxidoreductase [Sinimarinibacterium sp. NLF-5-8]
MEQSKFPAGATLVFGGSGGIGQGVARYFGQAGSDVAIVYRRKQDVAERVAGEIAADGRKATVHAADVRDPAQVQAAVDAAIAAHGRIHTVVWAAGPVVEQVHIADTTAELWKQSIDIEVHGFFNAVKATLPHLRAQGGGSYVTLGSAGHVWWPAKDGLSVAPKAANEALVQGIAKEEGKHNIRANSVLVGVIEAGMFLELLRRGVFDQAWTDETQKLLCIKRWGKPEEIGSAAVFLASNGYVTGQQINVSGGFGI